MSLKYLYALLFTVAVAAYAHTQINSPDQPQPGTLSPQADIPSGMLNEPGVLYHMPDVSKSLNLTPEQVSRLDKLSQQTRGQYRDRYAKVNALKDAERDAQMRALNQHYYNDWSTGARDILNEEQRTRYQQLYYQYGGFNSLSDPDVAKRLNLTPEQQKNLNANVEWSSRQLQEINKVAATNRDKAVQMYGDYQTQYQNRLNKFLTPDQQKGWRAMTGEPYTFQPALPPAQRR